MSNTILIVTDAWTPQVNGVVTTLTTTCKHLQARGYDVRVIEPSMFKTFSLPRYNEIKLSWNTWNIGKMIDEIGPDYIHIAVEGPLGIAARKWCLKNGKAFTTAYHTMFPEYLKMKYFIPTSWTYRFVNSFHSKSSAVMTANKGVDDLLYQKCRWLSSTTRWTRGVDTQLFHPKWRDPMFGEPFALYVGRVSNEKNIEQFLKADTPDLTKVVVGGGPQLAQLKAKYSDVVFTGPKHGEELAKFYANADVFVFPSKTDTFGLVMIEALASGTPVAAFNVSSPRDVLSPKVASLANGSNLTRAIAEARTLSREQCRKFVIDNYTWEIATDQFIKNLVPVDGGELGYYERLVNRLRSR